MKRRRCAQNVLKHIPGPERGGMRCPLKGAWKECGEQIMEVATRLLKKRKKKCVVLVLGVQQISVFVRGPLMSVERRNGPKPKEFLWIPCLERKRKGWPGYLAKELGLQRVKK